MFQRPLSRRLALAFAHALAWGGGLGGGAAWAQGELASAPTFAPNPVPQAVRPLRLNDLPALLALPPVLPIEGTTQRAEDSPEANHPLGLKATAQLGLAYSLEVEGARLRMESFGYTRDAARGALRPRADVRAGYGRGTLHTGNPALNLARKEATLTVRQTLFDSPARNEWQRQGVLAQSAALQWEGAASNALLESAGAWLAVLQSRVTVQLGVEYSQLLDELSRYITERAAAGGASPADRERVRGRVANVRAVMADSGAALKVALRNLNRLTGAVPPSVDLALPTADFDVPDERDEAYELALRQNHELLAARAEVGAAEVERQVQRGRFLPKLELEITHATNTNASGQESSSRETKAMVQMNWALLNGGTDLAQLRAAQARRGELQAKAGNVERKLDQELETAYANLQAATQRFAAVSDELDANAKVVAAFRAQMVGSNRSLLDVLDAFQRLHQSRLDLTQSLVSAAQNRLRVAHLTGLLALRMAPTAPSPSPVQDVPPLPLGEAGVRAEADTEAPAIQADTPPSAPHPSPLPLAQDGASDQPAVQDLPPLAVGEGAEAANPPPPWQDKE
jgi:outer membrane protein TolC